MNRRSIEYRLLALAGNWRGPTRDLLIEAARAAYKLRRENVRLKQELTKANNTITALASSAPVIITPSRIRNANTQLFGDDCELEARVGSFPDSGAKTLEPAAARNIARSFGNEA